MVKQQQIETPIAEYDDLFNSEKFGNLGNMNNISRNNQFK